MRSDGVLANASRGSSRPPPIRPATRVRRFIGMAVMASVSIQRVEADLQFDIARQLLQQQGLEREDLRGQRLDLAALGLVLDRLFQRHGNALSGLQRATEGIRDGVIEVAVRHHRRENFGVQRSEEHTSELQSLMRSSYA